MALASSLRNFFITFLIASLVFGGLAWFFYDDMEALLPQADAETSDEGPAVVSRPAESSSGGDIVIPVDPGDGLGILNGLIVTKNANGEVLSAQFMRFNSDKRIIVSCKLSLDASLYNDVNVPVPLRDYLRIYPITTSAQAICALTGYSADFYLELSPSSLYNMVENMQSPSFFLRQEVKYVNPIYENATLDPALPLPEDYYKEVHSGQIQLTKDTLDTLFEHYGRCDGSDGHGNFNSLLNDLYQSLLSQLADGERSVMESDPARFAGALSGGMTNMDTDFMNAHASLLLKYNEEAYVKKDVPYTSRDAVLRNIKSADR